ncbi:transposase [Haloferax elongans ATCC BAA-1513]|uniref:Transposase n=1 Tax=Haloferax elongans ATCC BAA-1513 TaxID=1230453 RepID=M0I0P3_HALEO|nr:hypothetical protein [Haloferax elongans]ELZ89507.1 transposase [Haloferax elongans ATCC BAA-1513]
MANVKQQTGGALSLLPQPDSELVVDPDERLEREADQAAKEALSGEGDAQIQRLPGTSAEVHIQRIPEGKVFEALALFQGELEDDADNSEHREAHNKNQLSFLHDVAQDVIEKQDHERMRDIKQEVQQATDPEAVKKELAQRGGSIADVKQQIEQLQQQVDADLEDVALTQDQRNELFGQVSTKKWDEVPWTVVKGILSATGIGAILPVAEIASKMSGYDADEYAEQATGRVRQGEISSWEDIKQIFYSESGDLKERAEKIEKQIREGTWLEEGQAPDDIPSPEAVE